MSDPIIPAAMSTLDPSVPGGYPSGLRFMAPGTPIPHDGVVYRSRGTILIIGDSVAAASVANVTRELARWTQAGIVLFAPGAGALHDLPPTVKAVGGRIVSLQGHLGKFSASVRVAVDKVEDAGIFSANADRYFDLVLDLGHEPLLRQSVLPYGYYAPGDDAMALAKALRSLRQLTGDFHKPKYFDYRPQLCAHGAMGVVGCTRCIDVCSTEAIRSTGEKIEVDPYLCQGCASCTLACPTGALGFLQPTPKALQGKLDELLTGWTEAEPEFLVVHDAASRHLLPVVNVPGALLFEVNSLPAFSDTLWLAALAKGLRGVVLVVAPATPPESRQLIEQKVSELHAMLTSLGRDSAILQVATPMNVGMAIDQIKGAVRPSVSGEAVTRLVTEEKRAGFLSLLDAIAASGRQTPGTVTKPEYCELGSGAVFGAVVVDAAKCTICLACTHLCPTGALSGQLDSAPSLFFKESLCIQCDLCRAGCPEKAIALRPRFLPNAAARDALRELARDQLVPCSRCGTPFTGRRKLAVSLALMQEHAQDMPGGLDSLRMCPSCRQRETMQA